MARKVKWFAVSAIATVAVGMTPFVSFAGEDPAAPAPAADAQDYGVSPEMATAMKRDLDLTDDELVTRLETEQDATRIQRRLEGKLGDSYAGAWIPDGADKLTVGVTDPADVAAVKAEGADAEVVTKSQDDLDSATAALEDNASKAVKSGAVRGWFVDVESNTVVMLAPPGKEAAAKQFAKDSGAGTVAVQTTTDQGEPTSGLLGGDQYFINQTGTTCSVGFAVTSGSANGYVTAGHCGKAGDSTNAGDGTEIGAFARSDFPLTDYAWVKTNTNWTPRPSVNNYSDSKTDDEVLIGGSDEATTKGAAICRSGATGKFSCGTLTWPEAAVVYPEGIVTGLRGSVDMCAGPGDSGGSVISGNQAQGIISGIIAYKASPCPDQTATFYQPINPVLKAYGLSLTVNETIKSAISPDPNKCIDVKGSSFYPVETSKVQLYTCNGTDAQKWVLQPSSDGKGTTVQSARYGLCLTAASSATSNPASMQLATCSDGLAAVQVFSFDQTSKWSRFTLNSTITSDTSKSIDISKGKPVDAADLILYSKAKSSDPDNESWSTAPIPSTLPASK